MSGYLAPPPLATTVPPRHAVPAFPPIRRGGGGRHRLRQAVRHRPGVLATGLLAAATALAAGPLRPGPPVPATSSAPVPSPGATGGSVGIAHCSGTAAPPG
ncbi:hypothetical protein [Kitasatospora camelliae]|uniref:Uncharacterized protein n=1 Tax=Kitasatospora camelliae TaxID=3156397 RepID=A0AAU8K0K5_9ACTN